MPASRIPCLNPDSRHLGTVNAVMGSAGIGAHHVRDFTGALSIKFMVQGSATWRSDAGVHQVDGGRFLVLNHGQTYSLDIDHDQPRESFCPFFRRGFVEDIRRTSITDDVRLLDDPDASGAAITFQECLHRGDSPIVPSLLRLRELVCRRAHEAPALDAAFLALGEALLAHYDSELRERIARVPARRASTRAECHRRVARGTEYLHAHAHEPVTLDELARESCLSPYHFHRLFKAIHGVTPHRYLTRLRLERARRLLRDPRLPVTQVALAVGFESVAAFSRRFSSEFGLSPSRYRIAAGGRKSARSAKSSFRRRG